MEGNNNYVKRTFVLDLINEVNSSGGFKSYSDYSTMFDLVDDMPAADVQPVKHGHWIEEVREVGGFFKLNQTYIHCSECGKEHYSGTLPKPNFCDNCGADMRGEGNA